MQGARLNFVHDTLSAGRLPRFFANSTVSHVAEAPPCHGGYTGSIPVRCASSSGRGLAAKAPVWGTGDRRFDPGRPDHLAECSSAARALALGARYRGFDSRLSDHFALAARWTCGAVLTRRLEVRFLSGAPRSCLQIGERGITFFPASRGSGGWPNRRSRGIGEYLREEVRWVRVPDRSQESRQRGQKRSALGQRAASSHFPGCSSAWPECRFRIPEIVGSNPTAPTILLRSPSGQGIGSTRRHSVVRVPGGARVPSSAEERRVDIAEVRGSRPRAPTRQGPFVYRIGCLDFHSGEAGSNPVGASICARSTTDSCT